VYNQDTDKAIWATYDKQLIGWNAQFLGNDKQAFDKASDQTISSKYGTGFTYISEAPIKKITSPEIDVAKDTIVDGERILELCVTPKRNVNRLDVFTGDTKVLRASVNGQPFSDHYLNNRRNGKLVTHYISKNNYTEIELAFPSNEVLELLFYESSNDLLQHKQFSVPTRPTESIPMPFVLNDAIMTTKTMTFE